MSRSSRNRHRGFEIELSAGCWVTYRRPEPALVGAPAQELLRASGAQPGCFRYAYGPDRSVELLGEAPAQVGDNLAGASEYLEALFSGRGGEDQTRADADAVERILDGLGLSWTAQGGEISLTINQGMPCQLSMKAVTAGWEVRGSLGQWDALGAVQTEALAEFLTAAQSSLRFARCEIGPTGAWVVSRPAAGRLDADVEEAIQAVLSGMQELSLESAALQNPGVSERFVNFHRTQNSSPVEAGLV